MTKNKYAFQQKVVIVTGAGSGIGRAIARAFLDNQANVVVVGRRTKPLEDTVKAYPAEQSLVVSADVTRQAAVKQIVQLTLQTFGHLDVVVSNAAAFVGGKIDQITTTDWETVRKTNIDSFFYLAREVFAPLKATQGNLVAISSVSGSGGDWGQAIYNASKHAVNGFVRSLALDWGKEGIRVNAVAPSFTVTEMNKEVADNQQKVQKFVDRIALERPGVPADIAPAVLFLASADAAYITGTILTVDGGTTASNGQAHND